MKKIIKIFIIGVAILLGAILLNFVANMLDLNTWYDVLNKKYDQNFLNNLWLFVIYPFCLGLVAYIVDWK